jgi:hypothetical protein
MMHQRNGPEYRSRWILVSENAICQIPFQGYGQYGTSVDGAYFSTTRNGLEMEGICRL